MKPFKLIQGTNNNITAFEDEIAEAITNGYELSGELIVKIIENNNNSDKVLFFQPMVIEEHLDFEDDDDFEEDDDEETL